MERQYHGFSFEKQIIEELDLNKSESYTAAWDAEKDGEVYSIKLEKYGSDIELADFFRNSCIDYNFHLIVGFWEGTEDNIIEVRHLYITGDDWSQLFGDHQFDDKFRNLLDNISNDASDDIKWKNEISKLKKEWKKETSNLIRPRFKRDHKKQKRIQCAVNNKDFYNYFCSRYEV